MRVIVALAFAVALAAAAAAAASGAAAAAEDPDAEYKTPKRLPPDVDGGRAAAMPARVHSLRPSPSSSSGDVFELSGRQAVTAVFTKPIVALGADWDAPDAAVALEVLPSPAALKVPVLRRWATTAIYRVDPDVAWPAEVEFTLRVPSALRAHDGKAVAGAGSAEASRRYRTRALRMTLGGVYSKRAADATGGQWSSCTPSVADAASADRGDAVAAFASYASCPGAADAVCELPADSVVTLRFNSPVDAARVGAALRIERAGATAPGALPSLAVSPCGGADDACVRVRLSGALPGDGAGERYAFVLPAGADFHAHSGPLRAAVRVHVHSLLPFRFPFRPATQLRNVAYRSYRMYLRHGLDTSAGAGGEASVLAALHAAITLTPVPRGGFELLRPAAHYVELRGQWAPGASVDVRVAAAAGVRDAFGFALRASRSAVTSAPHRNYLIGADAGEYAGVALEPFDGAAGGVGALEPLGFLHRGPMCGSRTRAVALSASNLGVALALLDDVHGALQANIDMPPGDTAAGADVSRSFADSSAVSLTTLPSASLLAPSGAFVRIDTVRSYNTYNTRCNTGSGAAARLTQLADVAVVWLGGGEHVDSIAFVAETHVARAPPVAGALVELWTLRQRAVAQRAMGVRTDADGLARFSAADMARHCGRGGSSTSRGCRVVVRRAPPPAHVAATGVSGAERIFVGDAVSRYTRTNFGLPQFGGDKPVPGPAPVVEAAQERGVIITDRRLYKAGDTVYFKGYVRAQRRTELLAGGDASKTRTTTVSAQFSPPPSPRTEVVATVSAANAYSFEGSLVVPADAAQGPVTLQASMGNVASAALLIADPRVPTGVLQLERVSGVYSPAADFAGATVRVRTSTYTQQPVPNRRVTLRWRVQRGSDFSFASGGGDGATPLSGVGSLLPRPWTLPSWDPTTPEPVASGDVEVTTGADGSVEHVLQLPADVAPRDGDTLQIDAEWIGPTRELLKDALALPVRASPLAVELRATTWDAVPGYAFGVFVDVTDVDGASLPADAAVTPDVTLRLWALGDDEDVAVDARTKRVTPPARAPTVPACVVPGAKADQGANIRCRFVLGTVARHLLLAEARDADGTLVQTAVRLGRTRAQWQRAPLRSFARLSALPEAASTPLGGRVAITFLSPCAGGSLLLRYGNRYSRPVVSRALSATAGGQERVEFDADAAVCRGGCDATIVVVCARGPHRAPLDLPTSALFDLGAPHAFQMRVPLTIDDDSLRAGAVSVEAPEAPVAPRDDVTVRVRVAGGAGADVHLFVVDAKILDLAPLPRTDVAAVFAPHARESDSVSLSTDRLAVRGAAKVARTVWERRARADPWIHPNGFGALLASNWAARDTDVADADFYERYKSDITAFPQCLYLSRAVGGGDEAAEFGGGGVGAGGGGGGGGGAVDANGPLASAAPPGGGALEQGAVASADRAAADGNKSGGAGGGGASVSLRGDDVRTPLSKTAVADANGVATFKIAMPDNISTFKLRAYAATQPSAAAPGGTFASAEAELVSERRLSLEPSVPRIVRQGDVFLAGATVTPSAAAVARGRFLVHVVAQIDCVDGTLDLLDVAERTTEVTGPGPLRVEWPFRALRQGGGAIKFSVREQAAPDADDGGKSVLRDARELRLPSLAPREAVSVATSFAIAAPARGAAAGEVRHAEGLVLPRALNGTGFISLTAGVGRQPAIDELAELLLDAVRSRAEPRGPAWEYVRPSSTASGEELAAAALVAPVLLAVHGAGAAHPTVLRAKALVPTAVALLDGAYTHATYGLLWRPPRANYPVRHYSTRLNAFGLWAAAQSEAAGSSGRLPLPTVAARTLALWRSALEQGLVTELARARQYNYEWRNYDTLALGYLALGGARGWATIGARDATFSYDSLVANRDKLSTFGRVVLALVQHAAGATLANGGGDGAVLADAVRFVDNQVRVQGRTAYVTWTAGGQQRDAAVSALGLWLGASLDGKRDDPLVEKLANGVARSADPPAQLQAGPVWRGPSAYYRLGAAHAAYAGRALQVYDVSRGNDAPQLVVRAAVGDAELLAPAKFTAVGQPPATAAANFSALRVAEVAEAGGGGSGGGDDDAPPPQLEFYVSGSAGEVSAVAQLTFTPADRDTPAVYRGIAVEKVVRRYDATKQAAVGGAITSAMPGEQVEITMQITTPDDLYDVQLIDPLPGNIEAFTPNLGEGSSAGGQPAGNLGTSTGGGGFPGGGDFAGPSRGGGGGLVLVSPRYVDYSWGWWWRSVWQSQEVHKDRLTAYSRYMWAGTHTLRVVALVVTPGVFALPPTKVYCLAQPELLGLSAGGTFDSDKEAVKASDAEPSASRCYRAAAPIVDDTTGEWVTQPVAPTLGDVAPTTTATTTTRDPNGDGQGTGGDGGDGSGSEPAPSSASSKWWVALIVVGVLALVVLVAALAFAAHRRQRNTRNATAAAAAAGNSGTPMGDASGATMLVRNASGQPHRHGSKRSSVRHSRRGSSRSVYAQV